MMRANVQSLHTINATQRQFAVSTQTQRILVERRVDAGHTRHVARIHVGEPQLTSFRRIQHGWSIERCKHMWRVSNAKRCKLHRLCTQRHTFRRTNTKSMFVIGFVETCGQQSAVAQTTQHIVGIVVGTQRSEEQRARQGGRAQRHTGHRRQRRQCKQTHGGVAPQPSTAQRGTLVVAALQRRHVHTRCFVRQIDFNLLFQFVG
mmetsp:Transcript_19423/g.33409  ORF Transcript_19423/g.33409 Transcript_19423/m.33409 type:complete len:204 (-) Transcript_19423:1645-2256(-)